MPAHNNEIRISSSVTGVAVLDETVGGNALSSKVVDQVVGSSGGGFNSMNYDDDGASKYVGILTKTSATALGTACFLSGAASKTGTDPAEANCFAVSYDSELGDAGILTVTIGSQIHAELLVGEGVAIPISGAGGVGLAKANMKLHIENAYSAGVDEASVTAVMIGQE